MLFKYLLGPGAMPVDLLGIGVMQEDSSDMVEFFNLTNLATRCKKDNSKSYILRINHDYDKRSVSLD